MNCNSIIRDALDSISHQNLNVDSSSIHSEEKAINPPRKKISIKAEEFKLPDIHKQNSRSVNHKSLRKKQEEAKQAQNRLLQHKPSINKIPLPNKDDAAGIESEVYKKLKINAYENNSGPVKYTYLNCNYGPSLELQNKPQGFIEISSDANKLYTPAKPTWWG
jgi:hypothetical protein